MPSISDTIIIGCYLFALIFGTHLLRTIAFGRHEAVTFECSSVALLFPLLLMTRNRCSWQLILISVFLCAGFIGNAFSQRYFYLIMQDRIKAALEKRAKHMDCHRQSVIKYSLLPMASRAIMPSFSSFLEESTWFSYPGNLIGLLKSVIRRERFQNKKFLMRECIADSINMIGLCKTEVNFLQGQETGEARDFTSGTVQASDLALKPEDEKRGLLCFDTLGFGAFVAIWCFLSSYMRINTIIESTTAQILLVPLLIVAGFAAINFFYGVLHLRVMNLLVMKCLFLHWQQLLLACSKR